MPGRHSSSNRSHTAGASGLAWRLISKVTVLVCHDPFLLRHNPHSHSHSYTTLALKLNVTTDTRTRTRTDTRTRTAHFAASYRLGRGLMNCVSTSSNSKCGPSTLPVKLALVVFRNSLVVALGKVRLVVRAARLVAQNRAQRDGPRKFQHVLKLPRKGKAGVGPLALVAQVHALVALEQLHDLLVGFLQVLVVADHGCVLGHGLAQLAPQLEGILSALVLDAACR